MCYSTVICRYDVIWVGSGAMEGKEGTCSSLCHLYDNLQLDRLRQSGYNLRKISNVRTNCRQVDCNFMLLEAVASKPHYTVTT